MTLPYPYEFETGRLATQAKRRRVPFDVASHMQRAIRREGTGMRVFGRHLEDDDPEAVGATLQRFRDTLTEHFQKHRGSADSATWETFAIQSRALVRGFSVV